MQQKLEKLLNHKFNGEKMKKDSRMWEKMNKVRSKKRIKNV